MSDDPNAGDPPVTPAAPSKDAGERPTGYSPEYVKDLREESKGYRLKAAEETKKRQELEEALKKSSQEAAAKIKAREEELNTEREAERKSFQQDKIKAELKVAAIQAGMIDLDGLKLADLSAVKLTDTGDVEGADELMVKLKEAKPYLFGSDKPGTSNPNLPPKPKIPSTKPALEMTSDEWARKMREVDAGKPIV